MKNNKEQFIEVPDQIPFRKITYFNVLGVKTSNNQFQIKLDRKCEDWELQKQYIIVRNVADFKWLFKQLETQSYWVIVLPSLMESSGWSILDAIGTNQTKTNLKKWSNQCYQCKAIYRFLKIISLISLKYIYKVPGFNQSSLFTFLDKSFELYKLQKYQQTIIVKQPPAANSKLTQFAQTIGKGSLKLLGMLNIVKQAPSNKYLIKQTTRLQQLKRQLQTLNSQLDKLQKGLDFLSQNFLSQQKSLKVKQQKIYETHLKINDIFRLTTQILNQTGQVLRRYKMLQQKNDDKANIKEQITEYQTFIDAQIKDIQNDFQKIVGQIYKQTYEQNVKIKIANIYPCRI